MSAKQREHLEKARDSLQALLQDKRLSSESRARLAEDFRQLQRLLDKLERGDVHIAVFGRVSVGKSALLNALLGHEVFAVSVLHGHTRESSAHFWQSHDDGGVFFLDTPGIDEVDGQLRAEIAEAVAKQADVVLFVVDSDLSVLEEEALFALHERAQAVFLVLNKADRYEESALDALLASFRSRFAPFVVEDGIFAVSARPAPSLEIVVDAWGNEEEVRVAKAPDVEVLRERLWAFLCARGLSYAALNAGVFASDLSAKVALEVVQAKEDLAESVIRHYGLIKALGVALNPIPVVDLLALAADTGMVVHLARLYGFSLTRHEAGKLLRSIAGQTVLLMGTVYGAQFLSSALKGFSVGLSTVITASAQAAVAFYGSYVIGQAARRYFVDGASWGEKGARQVVKEIMADLDKKALMEEARLSVASFLKGRK